MRMTLIATVCAVFAQTVWDQPETKAPARPTEPEEIKARARGWERISREGMTSAAESARADAMEQLARRISRLRLSPEHRVDAYLKLSDEAARAIRESFPDVEFSIPRYQPDQTCAVRARVSIDSVMSRLKSLHRRYPVGGFDDRDWDGIRTLNREENITVVGRGVPPLDELPRRSRAAGDAPAWSIETRSVTGVAPQPDSRLGTPAGKLIAARRAAARARRDLASQLRALQLPGSEERLVGHELDRRPELAARYQEWIDEVPVVDTYWRENGNAVVRIEANLDVLWTLISPRQTIRDPTPSTRSPVGRAREQQDRPDRR